MSQQGVEEGRRWRREVPGPSCQQLICIYIKTDNSCSFEGILERSEKLPTKYSSFPERWSEPTLADTQYSYSVCFAHLTCISINHNRSYYLNIEEK